MFQRTSSQLSMFELNHLLPAAKRERLAKSWAHPFRERVLPLIDEEVFRDAFHPVLGAPNRSIRLLTGLHILKEWFNLTDDEVLGQLEYNLQWQYALGVEPAEAHLPQKTLHNYRVKLLANERAREMFERVTVGLVALDGLEVGRQRLDSTHVLSNMAVLTRLGLFVETVTTFLKELRRALPGRLAALNGGYSKRYLDREGTFSDVKREQARRRLPVVAVDVYRLLRRFQGDSEVVALESYGLLARLFEEQCTLSDEASPSEGSDLVVVASPVEEDEAPAVEPFAAEDEDDLGAVEPATAENEDDLGAVEPSAAENEDDLTAVEPSAAEDEDDLATVEPAAAEDKDDLGAVEPAAAEDEDDLTAVEPAAAEDTAPPVDPVRADTMAPEAPIPPVQLKEPKTIASASLQSPHDPDATYGHKGKGYEIQLVETCEKDNPYQVITAVAVNGAHESDQNATLPIAEQLMESGLMPDELFADTNYGSGENIVACAELGIDLRAPVQDPAKSKPVSRSWDAPVEPEPASETEAPPAPAPSLPAEPPLGLEDFRFSPTFDEIFACPAGHAPRAQHTDAAERTLWAEFQEEHCANCPFADRCPTRRKASGDRTLRARRSQAATAHRQREQQSPEFREAYKVRSGIESTNAELKGRHGAGSLRIRGQDRVHLVMTLKALALNIKRAVLHHVEASRPRPTLEEALAAA
jgi:hypothetical protein